MRKFSFQLYLQPIVFRYKTQGYIVYETSKKCYAFYLENIYTGPTSQDDETPSYYGLTPSVI
jgi:hypothetical protein